MDNGLKAVVDRQEGEFWVLKISGDQELYWPKNKTKLTLVDSDVVNINLTKDELSTVTQEETAKSLLKQIFQPNA